MVSMQRPRLCPDGQRRLQAVDLPPKPFFLPCVWRAKQYGSEREGGLGTDSPDHTGQRPEIQVMASVPVLKGGTVQAPLYLIERKTVLKR